MYSNVPIRVTTIRQPYSLHKSNCCTLAPTWHQGEARRAYLGGRRVRPTTPPLVCYLAHGNQLPFQLQPATNAHTTTTGLYRSPAKAPNQTETQTSIKYQIKGVTQIQQKAIFLQNISPPPTTNCNLSIQFNYTSSQSYKQVV